jgi:glutamyl-tRNA synthetase
LQKDTIMNFDQLLHIANKLRAERPRSRYAPSPTGPLHLGNARTAILAWLQTRLMDGVFIMRNEDLDLPRVIEGSDQQIYEDLYWLELDWDEGPDIGGPVGPYNQSERSGLYEEALQRLDEKGVVFRCYCSRKDVREASSAPHDSGRVLYPGTCRFLSPEEEAEIQAEKPDRTPSWRYRVPARELSVEDVVAGTFTQHLNTAVGDFPIRRADALFAYQLAVVVDDALMGVTDVLRGVDLLPSTPRQIELFEALDLPVPHFWHVPLMCDEEGNRMSKRIESNSIQELRAQGKSPAEVVGMLAASVGLAEPGEAVSVGRLLDRLTLEEFQEVLRAQLADQPPG